MSGYSKPKIIMFSITGYETFCQPLFVISAKPLERKQPWVYWPLNLHETILESKLSGFFFKFGINFDPCTFLLTLDQDRSKVADR